MDCPSPALQCIISTLHKEVSDAQPDLQLKVHLLVVQEEEHRGAVLKKMFGLEQK
jgi:hypothetical protein